jgi:hypothetical protein
MTKQFYRDVIKKYRRSLTSAQRKSFYRQKPPRQKYPHKYERSLEKSISSILQGYIKKVYPFIEKRIPRMQSDSLVLDSFESEFHFFMNGMEEEIRLSIVEGGLHFNMVAVMTKISTFMLTFAEEEVSAYFKKLSGKAFYGSTEWWGDLEAEWISAGEQYLAKSLYQYTDTIRNYVFQAIKDDIGFEAILKKIKQIDASLTEKRANFIARDLTGKLNGNLEKNLQTSIGITGYMWQTMADERVRGKPDGKYPGAIPSHWEIDSLVCRWNDPSVISRDHGKTWIPKTPTMPTMHPGYDWQCRCMGAPFAIDLIRTIDSEIERENYGKAV